MLRLSVPIVMAGLACVCAVGLSGRAAAQEPSANQEQGAFRVLLFSKTAGFRHECIPAGIEAIRKLGNDNGFTVDATEDAGAFTEGNLARYAVLIFLNTTGDVLNDSQQAAMERFIRSGKGFVGIHAATDTEYEWPWYGQLVGAYFKSHPKVQEATIAVADRTHPSTRHLPPRWTRTDEWYDFRTEPSGVNILATLDESTYEGGTMGDHPIVWCHEFDGGRSWYTGVGHTNETFQEPDVLKHLLGGIQWAAGITEPPKEQKKPRPAPAG